MLSRVVTWLCQGIPELLLALVILSGWGLVAWGVALLTTPKVWPLFAGVLLLSCAGWRLLWSIATHGFYALTREDGRRA